ncbi:MAG: class I SAM-dependent methyltransferase [Nostoc sp. DedQUE08]|uniref:class I SAM-dependent methyltransferase n=1 Tax=Nostoc sp. DedQUE08 TaxID=3075393 RepID=UPI002AD4A9F8|nr:class I SAM-dependent methyltransferase [Nostoc sp. DedQUE08]MDZ8066069.1 class I SAM-dependent methyltransferase [Nostoc sp. DedQUE08]
MVQSQASSFDAISPTALMVAYTRQFTDIPYGKELSQLVNAESFIEQLQQKQLSQPSEVSVLVEARYKAVNQVISQHLQFETTQIIELASGLLPRGMAMSQNQNITFVESDLPTMISQKQQFVKRLIGERQNLYFEAIDATNQPSQFPLNVNYLHQNQPVVVLCEGLLTYLTLAEKQKVFANVREILQVYDGVWITPDLTTFDGLNQLRQISPGLQRLNQTASNVSGRAINNYHFENIDHVKQFAYEQGFDIKEYSMLEVMNQITCLKPLGIEPEVVKSMLAIGSTFVLTLCNS